MKPLTYIYPTRKNVKAKEHTKDVASKVSKEKNLNKYCFLYTDIYGFTACSIVLFFLQYMFMYCSYTSR